MSLPDDFIAAQISRWLLAVFFTLMAVFYTIRILTLSRRISISPVHLGAWGSRHCVHYTIFRFFRAAILTVCVSRAFWPQIDALLVPLTLLWRPAILVTGNVLLLLSFAMILYTHFYMDRSWCSGIADNSDIPLITTGPFAVSRNPMFLLIQFGQLGLFLSLPSLFTLVCLVVGAVIIRAQTLLEEEHLRQRHGDSYLNYCKSVPRWFRFRSNGVADSG